MDPDRMTSCRRPVWAVFIAILGVASGVFAQDDEAHVSLAIADAPSSTTVVRETVPEPARDPSAPIRVGFVDVEIVLTSSKAITSIMDEIDKELGSESDAIDRKQAEARRLRIALEQQDALLTETERQKRQQRVLDLIAEVDEMEFRFQRKVKDRQRDTVEPILEKVVKLIGEVGRKEGYDLVVRGEMVLYGRGPADLTPAVIREIDSREAEFRTLVFGTAKPTAGPPEEQADPPPIPLKP